MPQGHTKGYLACSTVKMENQFDLLIDSYLDNNIGIDAGFMNERLCNGLQQNIAQLQKDDLMQLPVLAMKK